MALKFVRSGSFSLLLGALVAVACAPGGSQAGAKVAASPPTSAPTQPRPVHKVRSYPERRPEVGIKTPMKGEPTPAALAEARLVVSSCEKAKTEDVGARVKE